MFCGFNKEPNTNQYFLNKTSSFLIFQISGQLRSQEPEESAAFAAEDVAGGGEVLRQHHHASHGPGCQQGGGDEGPAQVSLNFWV